MKKSKKFLCLILAMVILIPNIAIFGNVFAQTADTEPLKVEVTTDKSSYTAYGIAEITVKVTNTSDEAVNNISAEAVFEQLAPVGKNNETFKEVESLQSGESFTFSYKATLNANKVNINFFEKIILWFVRLFNGGYNATSHNIEAVTEDITEIKFGNYVVQNIVKVGYDENQSISNNSFEFLNFETDTFNVNVGETKTITFSATVFSESILPDGTVKLYEKNDGFIGVLHDNGQNSDLETNDGIFTGSFSFSPTKRETKTFYAEANGIKSNIIRVGFTQSISDNENNELETFKEDIAQIKAKYCLNNEKNYSDDEVLQNAKNAYNEIIYYLNNSEIVKSHNTTTFCIMVEFKSGINMAVDLTDLLPDDNTERIGYQSVYSNTLTQSKTQTQGSKQGIACLRALGGINSNSFINASNTIVKSNSNYIVYPNLYKEQVTINSLKELADCRIILFDSHGGNDAEHGYCTVVYEKVTAEKNKELERNGDLNVTVSPVENGKGYIIYESFFEKYYSSGDFDNSLIYLGTCHGGDSNVNINSILLRKGAQTVLSYSNVVAGGYNGEMIETIADNLSNGSNINDAVKKAKEKHGNYSPTATDELFDEFISWIKGEKYKKAELIIHGSKDFRLSNGYISGTIKFNNTPVSNAKIDITNNISKNHSVTSNKDGYFSCPLSAGTYTITISKYGYETKVIKNVIVSDEFTNNLGNISLSKAEDTTISSVHGTVIDSETQRAISNVKVTLYSEDTQATYTTVTDEIGDFNFENLTAGRYTLSFEHEDYTINETNSFTLDEGLMFVFTDPFEFAKKSSSGEDDSGDTGDDSGETTDPVRTVTASGNCGANGDNVTWTLYDDGELVISGNGAMEDYDFRKAPWYSYNYSIKKVVIDNGIINIGACAFYECYHLAEIIIPDSVTIIDIYAFKDCYSLIEITIPKNVTIINDYAFFNCYKLTEIVIPISVTTIGDYAFAWCHGLENVNIPYSVTIIGNSPFISKNLKKITVDENNLFFCADNYGVLYNKNKTELIEFPVGSEITEYNIPSGVVSINTSAFSFSGYIALGNFKSNNRTNLKKISISDSVTNIGDFAFANCNNLTSITIPNGVTSIGDSTFENCTSLTNITIPNNVKSIGDSAFRYCTSIVSITIPNSVSTISDYAFMDCTSLTEITIPNSVTEICWRAFSDCENLTDVYYTGTQTQWDNIYIDDYNTYLTNATIHYNS